MKFRDFLRDQYLLIMELMYISPSILGHRDSALTFILENILFIQEYPFHSKPHKMHYPKNSGKKMEFRSVPTDPLDHINGTMGGSKCTNHSRSS